MLVLSRKQGQRIQIGGSVVLTVLESRNGQVRLGFEAPEGVTILRDEVCDGSREEIVQTERRRRHAGTKG
jgi:carbon storage regulator